MLVERQVAGIQPWDCVTVPLGISDSCYYLRGGAGGWWEAIRACQGVGHLAIFSTDLEWQAVVERLRRRGGKHKHIPYLEKQQKCVVLQEYYCNR